MTHRNPMDGERSRRARLRIESKPRPRSTCEPPNGNGRVNGCGDDCLVVSALHGQMNGGSRGSTCPNGTRRECARDARANIPSNVNVGIRGIGRHSHGRKQAPIDRSTRRLDSQRRSLRRSRCRTHGSIHRCSRHTGCHIGDQRGPVVERTR